MCHSLRLCLDLAVFYCYLFVLVNDVQLSCYRILTCLYSLGTGKNIFVER